MANMSNFMAVKGDNGDVLGKILYFSLANILIEKPVLEQLCQTMDLPYSKGRMFLIWGYGYPACPILEGCRYRRHGAVKTAGMDIILLLYRRAAKWSRKNM